MPRTSTPRRTARRIGAAVAALTATLVAVGSPAPSLAVEPTLYVRQGDTIELIATTFCFANQDPPVEVIVSPSTAGSGALGPNSCGATFTASTTFTGNAVIGVGSASTGNGVGFQVVVVAVASAVVQGDTIELLPNTCPANPLPEDTQAVVNPTEAGVALVRPDRCGVAFTASRTYLGPASIAIGGPGAFVLVDRTVVKAPTNLVRPSATANGSFTPVAPPGPCILISANPNVSFGDVTLGGPYRNGNVAPTVTGCAVAAVSQDVLVQASSATNGQETLVTDTSCLSPVGCTPGSGAYSVAIPADSLTVRSTPTLWLNGLPGNFAGQAVGLAVKLPNTLAPTSIGSLFTFNVTFTAVVD